jgi:hypothetical protein
VRQQKLKAKSALSHNVCNSPWQRFTGRADFPPARVLRYITCFARTALRAGDGTCGST